MAFVFEKLFAATVTVQSIFSPDVNVATIFVLPFFFAVTFPLLSTVAIDLSRYVHDFTFAPETESFFVNPAVIVALD